MVAGKCEVCLEDKANVVTCARCGNRKYCGAACQRKDWPSHKLSCQPQKQPSWILKITLPDSFEPQVTRTLVCPDKATFEQLHKAIQIAFGWASCHSYDFVARDPTADEWPVLDNATHLARRLARQRGEWVDPFARQNFVRFTNPERDNDTLKAELVFELDRSHPETPEKSAANVFVGEQFRKKEHKDAEWEYVYDFARKWGHEIEVTGRGKVDDGFQCIDGNGHGIAEDVPSMRGWDIVKAAYETSNPSAVQKQRMEWFEKAAFNADPKGLKGRQNFWDKEDINSRLSNIE